MLHLLFVTSLPAPFCVNPSCTWELPCPAGGKDIFAHTQQFTGDGDSLRGGERVIFAAWLGDLGWVKLGISVPQRYSKKSDLKGVLYTHYWPSPPESATICCATKVLPGDPKISANWPHGPHGLQDIQSGIVVPCNAQRLRVWRIQKQLSFPAKIEKGFSWPGLAQGE